MTGSVVSWDHTFNVSSKIKSTDACTGLQFSPVGSIFAWNNEVGQIGSLILTRSTSTEERLEVAVDLNRRHQERQMPQPMGYSDNCCLDSTWIRKEMPTIHICLDSYHLINRFAEKANRTNKSSHEIFVREVAKIVTSCHQGDAVNQSGEKIYEDLGLFIKKFAAQEESSEVECSHRVVGEELLKCYQRQKPHFIHCYPPLGFGNHVINRWGKAISRHGSNKLEAFWRSLKDMFPLHCSIDFAVAALLLSASSWNLARDMMNCTRSALQTSIKSHTFGDRWPFIPIAVRDLPLTQFMSIEHDDFGVLANLKFPVVPLGRGDGEDIFGLTRAFRECIPSLPKIRRDEEDGMMEAAAVMLEASSLDTVFDPIITNILEETHANLSNLNGQPSPEFLQHGHDMDDVSVEAEDANPCKKRRRRRSHANEGTTHARKDDPHHKSRIPLEKRGISGRYGPQSLIKTFGRSFDEICPLFNIIEKNLVRGIALTLLDPEISSGEINLRRIDVQKFPFQTLTKIWMLTVAAMKLKAEKSVNQVPVALIRRKTAAALKEELLKQIATETFNWKMPAHKKDRSIVRALIEAAKMIHNTSTPVLAETSQDKIALTASEACAVNSAELHSDELVNEGGTEMEGETDVGTQNGEEETVIVTPENLPIFMQVIEESRFGILKRIDWKNTVYPRWKRMKLPECEFAKLRKKYENLKAQAQKVPVTTQEDIPVQANNGAICESAFCHSEPLLYSSGRIVRRTCDSQHVCSRGRRK